MNKDYYIVTGANGSIGQAITEALAAQNLPVVMGCRNIAKSQPIRQRIIEKTGNSDILLLPLDLASFQSISHFCKQLAETDISIKALVNNAGVMCKDFGKTVDGFETSIGVNYIGTIFLTESLIPLMHPGSRIVMTTSLTRYRENRFLFFLRLTPNLQTIQGIRKIETRPYHVHSTFVHENSR